jgi:UV DNA damage endonuclease
MDIFGLEQSQQFPINIHCNGVYEGKAEAMGRWCKNYEQLSRSAKRRLVVENDDKASMYSVQDLFDGIHKKIGIPITFDYHHHRFNNGGLTEKSAFILAYETWHRNGVKPLFHYSSCRRTFEDPECKAQAHADYIYERINDYGMAVDIEIEAKAKDFALIKYIKTQNLLLEEYLPM